MSDHHPDHHDSRRRLLLGGAAVPAVALGMAAWRSSPASAADLDHALEARTITEVRAGAATPPVPGYVVTDRRREGIFLLNADDTSSGDDGGLVVVDTAGRRYHRLVDHGLDPRWFGAAGDGTTDDTEAIRASIVASTALEPPLALVFAEAPGYRTTDTITVPPGIDVIMHAPLLYTGPPDRAALDIGTHNVVNRGRHLRLDVQRPAGTGHADWTTEDHIGIVLRNLDTCTVDITNAIGFTIGAQCYGDSAGFAYNTIQLGYLVANKIALDLTNRDGGNGIGWTNENLFLGGRFGTYSTLNKGQSRYGVRIRSTDNTYLNNNNNVFLKPSFELNATASAPEESLPILIEAGSLNKFDSARNESNGPVTMRVTGESSRNVVETGYGAATVDDQATYPSSEVHARGALAHLPVEVFSSGSLRERACYYDGDTRIHLPGLSFCVRTTGAVAVSGRAVLASDHIEINTSSNDAPGVVVNTVSNKRFVVKSDTVTGYGGRVHFVCLDSAGGILPDPAAGIGGALIRTLPSATVAWLPDYFGGSYRNGVDTNNRSFYFQVADEVASVRVMFWRGTEILKLRSFTVQALDKTAPTVTSGCGHPNDQRIATSCPTAGQWSRGMTIHNAAPSVLGTPDPYIVSGWTKITDGSTNIVGTDWVELRAPVSP